MFWYEDDIKHLETERAALTYKPATLFYGSSSIRLWTTLKDDFKDLKPVNLGFGGSTLAACTWFFDRVMQGYKPERIIFYAGDNDLGDGRHPEEVYIFFQQFAERVKKTFGSIPCYFISLKPSIARREIINQFRFTNEIIATEIKNNHPDWRWIDVFTDMLTADGRPVDAYYAADGLHLSKQGYQLWAKKVKDALNTN